MKPYEIDSTLKIHDIEYENTLITMILKETLLADGSKEFSCIRYSDPFINPIKKEQLNVLNNLEMMKDIKYNLLGFKKSDELGLTFLDEVPLKQNLFDKIKGVFSAKI